MVNKFIITSGFLFLSIFCHSQDTLMLSVQDALQKAGNGNLQIKMAQKNYESALADYRQSNALFLPDIAVSHTAFTTTNPLMAFGSKLNQEVVTAADFNPALLNDPGRIDNVATKIDVRQPILNIDGFIERKAARLKSEAFALQAERTREYQMLEVNKAFVQLQLAYRLVSVLESARRTAESNFKLTEDYFMQGLLQKSDVLAMNIRLTEISNQLSAAKSNVQNISDYLSFLFNEENTGTVFKPSGTIEENIVTEKNMGPVSPERKDIQAKGKLLDAYKKLMHADKMRLMPRINAFGSYELYDSELFQTGANGYLVGAQLSWNLFDGYKTMGKIQKARTDYSKESIGFEEYKAQSNLDLKKTNRQLMDAENRFYLSKQSLEQSKEAYRLRKNRFDQGLEKTSDLLFAETQMLQKEMEHLQSIYEYNLTKLQLQFLTK
jgi:outer membrane protein TolC